MNKTKILLLSILGFFLIMAGCEKTGDDPVGNRLPDTQIISYTVNTNPELDSTGAVTKMYGVQVFWLGSDVDGSPVGYNYWVGNDQPTYTTASSAVIPMDFSQADATYELKVATVDDRGDADPTPATAVIMRDLQGVETTFLDGPPNGAVVGTAIEYKIKATVQTGTAVAIDWWINDGSVLSGSVEPDSVNEARVSLTGLPGGAHIAYFATRRDDGKTDDTPVSVSFEVHPGEFAPTIVNQSAVEDGGGWFSGADLPFSWDVVTDYYYGTMPESGFSYAFDDATNFDDTQNPLASGWVSDQSYTAPANLVTAGQHTLYLKAIDKGGAVSKTSITVQVAEFNPTDGILVIDDVSWVPSGYDDNDDINNQIASGFLNNYPHTLRADDAGPVGPDDLASYSSVILYGDYGFDNQANGALFVAYASAGGNVFICGYNLVDFEPTMPDYGFYPGIFGLGEGNYGGMDGAEGTAYENFHIDLPPSYSSRSYHRFYADADNTESIFHVRGLDGDDRSCAVRADMPQGNVVIFVGQSLPFMDQTKQDTKDFGKYVLETEFGETK